MNNRNFDNWNRYLDNDGNILRGCIQFMVLDGTTSAPIFDSDGVALSNPQITDIYGRTQHQVFIESDVLVYFYKYVGQGTIEEEEALGIDTSDETKWSLQYTSESTLTVDITGSTDGVKTVTDIEALHALDPATIPAIGDKKFIQLLGYYEEGDLEPAYYWWDDTSTENEDGGSIIASPELTGRWKLIPPLVHLDVRRFGAFPYSSTYQVDSQRVKIMNAVAYANRVGLRVWFPRYDETTPNNISYKYYKYDNLSLTFVNGLDVDEGVQFIDSGSSSVFRFSDIRGDLYFIDGNTSVASRYAKASWNIRNLMKYSVDLRCEYIIDDMDHSASVRTLQDWDVITKTFPIYGFTFNNCRISELKRLGSKDGVYNTFVNCRLTSKMFYTTEDSNVASLTGKCTNCQVDIDDFTDALWLWNQWRCTDNYSMNIDWRNNEAGGTAPYQNFNGITLTGNTVTVLNYRNSFSTPVSLAKLSNMTTIVLDHCEGYFYLPASITVKITNSNVILRMARSVDLIAEDSTIQLDGTNNVGSPLCNYNLKNCTITNVSGVDENLRYKCSNLTLYHSIVLVGFNADNVFAKGCQINRIIATIFDDSKANTVFYDSNIFNAYTAISGQTSGVHHVRAAWTNNIATVGSPIFIDRTNLDPIDSSHSYTYQNNSGRFLSDKYTSTKSVTLTVHYVQESDPNNNTRINGIQDSLTLLRPMTLGNDLGMTSAGVYLYNAYFDTASFFRIGTDSFKIGLVIERVLGNGLRQGTPVMQTLEGTFQTGFEYGLKTKLSGEWAPIGGTYHIANFPAYYQTVCLTGLPTVSGSTPNLYRVAVELHYVNLDKYLS